MNDKNGSSGADKTVDAKVAADWAEIDARRAELNSRDGGDTRRQAIMKRLELLKRAS